MADLYGNENTESESPSWWNNFINGGDKTETEEEKRRRLESEAIAKESAQQGARALANLQSPATSSARRVADEPVVPTPPVIGPNGETISPQINPPITIPQSQSMAAGAQPQSYPVTPNTPLQGSVLPPQPQVAIPQNPQQSILQNLNPLGTAQAGTLPPQMVQPVLSAGQSYPPPANAATASQAPPQPAQSALSSGMPYPPAPNPATAYQGKLGPPGQGVLDTGQPYPPATTPRSAPMVSPATSGSVIGPEPKLEDFASERDYAEAYAAWGNKKETERLKENLVAEVGHKLLKSEVQTALADPNISGKELDDLILNAEKNGLSQDDVMELFAKRSNNKKVKAEADRYLELKKRADSGDPEADAEIVKMYEKSKLSKERNKQNEFSIWRVIFAPTREAGLRELGKAGIGTSIHTSLVDGRPAQMVYDATGKVVRGYFADGTQLTSEQQAGAESHLKSLGETPKVIGQLADGTTIIQQGRGFYKNNVSAANQLDSIPKGMTHVGQQERQRFQDEQRAERAETQRQIKEADAGRLAYQTDFAKFQDPVSAQAAADAATANYRRTNPPITTENYKSSIPPVITAKPDGSADFSSILPNGGTLTSPQGKRTGTEKGVDLHGDHNGVDIAAPLGSPITAPVSGTVVTAGPFGNAGNMVSIKDEDGRVHAFMHMDKIGVKPGDTITAGSQLGTVGSTGKSTGPHVHYEFRNADGTFGDALSGLKPKEKPTTDTGEKSSDDEGGKFKPGTKEYYTDPESPGYTLRRTSSIAQKVGINPDSDSKSIKQREELQQRLPELKNKAERYFNYVDQMPTHLPKGDDMIINREIARLEKENERKFDKTNYKAKIDIDKNYSSGPASRQLVANNTSVETLIKLKAAADALNNGNIQVANKIFNSIGGQFGKEQITNFNTLAKIAGPEFMKSIIPQGGTGQERREAEELVSSKMSPDQVLGTINILLNMHKTNMRSQQGQYTAKNIYTPADFNNNIVKNYQGLQELAEGKFDNLGAPKSTEIAPGITLDAIAAERARRQKEKK